jgi:hypothetical protein
VVGDGGSGGGSRVRLRSFRDITVNTNEAAD